MKLADKHGLPKVIKDFIITHHGNGTARYFYISSQNANPDKTIDKSKFSYSGPNPTTKETAIVMMADSIEAASRCLDNYTEENINNLVEQIINAQVAEGFFKDSPLTFKDINDIKSEGQSHLISLSFFDSKERIDSFISSLSDIDFVQKIERTANGNIQLAVVDEILAGQKLPKLIQENNLSLKKFEVQSRGLESIFMEVISND